MRTRGKGEHEGLWELSRCILNVRDGTRQGGSHDRCGPRPIGTHGMHHFLPIRHRVFDLRFIKEWTLIFITYDTT